MKRLRTRMGLAASVAAATAGLALATAVPALAVTFIGRDVPTTAVIAPGASGPVAFTYQNTGASGTINGTGNQVVFTAPASTTFAPQSSIPGQYSSDGTSWISNYMTLTSCALSNANATLTCQGTAIGPGGISWPAGGYFRFSPTVTVSATAPSGTTLTPGTASMTLTVSDGTTYTITDGTLNVATPPAPGANAKCLDTQGGGRTNNTNIHIWQCFAGLRNQQWVIDSGKIIIADTYGTRTPMCLTIRGGSNANGTNVILYQCVTDNSGYTNQTWVIRGGMIYRKSTMATSNATCLDAGTSRANGGNVIIWQCGTSTSPNTNQFFTIQSGSIKVDDTL